MSKDAMSKLGTISEYADIPIFIINFFSIKKCKKMKSAKLIKPPRAMIVKK